LYFSLFLPELVQLTMYQSRMEPQYRTQAAVEEIMAHAGHRNLARGIGGKLFMDSDYNITQLLEGPPGAVDALVKRIISDPRHRVAGSPVSAMSPRLFTKPGMDFQLDSSAFISLTYISLLHPQFRGDDILDLVAAADKKNRFLMIGASFELDEQGQVAGLP
jgi:hypothetical protein